MGEGLVGGPHQGGGKKGRRRGKEPFRNCRACLIIGRGKAPAGEALFARREGTRRDEVCLTLKGGQRPFFLGR